MRPLIQHISWQSVGSLIVLTASLGLLGNLVRSQSSVQQGSSGQQNPIALLLDNDHDGLPDSWELKYFGDLDEDANGDPDADNLLNLPEYRVGTDPTNADTDRDGLNDGAEVNTHGTDPLDSDSDDDGLSDGDEVNTHGTDPLDTDTDDDDLSDGDEVNTYGTDPLDEDTDDDDMPDGWEVSNSLDPLLIDAYADADGDRYPNVFEYVKGTDPQLAASFPIYDFLVDDSQVGAGIFATLQGGIDAVGADYEIVAVAADSYAGVGNTSISIGSTDERMLLIGLQGATATIIDGEGANGGIAIDNPSVISGFTIDNTANNANGAVDFLSGATGAFLVDCVLTNNSGIKTGGVYLDGATGVRIASTTVFDNAAVTGLGDGLRALNSAEAHIENSLLWNDGGHGETDVDVGSTVTSSFSLFRNDEIPGTGNVTGVGDPKVDTDGHLLTGSPAIDAGNITLGSLFDMDLNPRLGTLDIGADEYDSDDDGLSDAWEILHFGDLAQNETGDPDEDLLANLGEFQIGTDPNNPDTDDDHVNDGNEVGAGLDPLSNINTDGDSLPDDWEQFYFLALDRDDDGDEDVDFIKNIYEWGAYLDPTVNDFIAGPNTSAVEYDGDGRLTTFDPPTSGPVTFTFDDEGNIEGVSQ